MSQKTGTSHRLSEKQAYDAMVLFVGQWINRAGNDAEMLLSDITPMTSTGQPFDPAQWEDWQKCVDQILSSDARPQV